MPLFGQFDKKAAAVEIKDTWACMLLHETCVKTIVEAVASQHSAVLLMLEQLGLLEISTGVEDVQHSKDVSIKQNVNLIKSIEKILTIQCDGLKKSLSKVQTSLKDFIIKRFDKEFEFDKCYDDSQAKSHDSKQTQTERSTFSGRNSKSVPQRNTRCNVDEKLEDVDSKEKIINDQSAARELEFKDIETNVDVGCYKKEIEQLREIIKQKEKLIDDQNRHISMHQAAQAGALKDDISSQKGKTEDHLRQIGDLKLDHKRHQTEIDELKHDKSNKMDEIEGFLQQIGELKSDKERYQTEINSLKNVSIYQDGEIAKLLRQIDGLEADLSKLREKFKTKVQKQKLEVQIYRPGKTANLERVIKDLHSLLSSNLESEDLILKITECESISNVQADIPTLVVCVNASRLGTDVTSCLQGLTLSAKVLVVVLHHKDVHALPNQKSEKMLASEIVRSVGSVIDMAFLSEKGLYSCTMNLEATSNIVKFLQIHHDGVI